MNDREKEILLLEKLIEELTQKLNNVKNYNDEEIFLTRPLRSFSDFPYTKEKSIWGRVEKRLNIYTVDDLVHFNPADFKKVYGMGEVRIKNIEDWMKKYNLFFLSKCKI